MVPWGFYFIFGLFVKTVFINLIPKFPGYLIVSIKKRFDIGCHFCERVYINFTSVDIWNINCEIYTIYRYWLRFGVIDFVANKPKHSNGVSRILIRGKQNKMVQFMDEFMVQSLRIKGMASGESSDRLNHTLSHVLRLTTRWLDKLGNNGKGVRLNGK